MPTDIREFLMMLREREYVPFTQGTFRLLDELADNIRHNNLIIYSPSDIHDLAHILEGIIRLKSYSQLQRARLVRKLQDLNFACQITMATYGPYLRDILLPRLNLFLAELEGKPPEEAKEEKEKKQNEKVLESIKNLQCDLNTKVLFFVGAGASKPSPSDIPTVNELLPELWKKSSLMEKKPLEKLRTWCTENNIKNIEEMLTAVTISNFIIENSKVHGLLKSVLYPEWERLKGMSIRDIDSVLHLNNMLDTIFSLLVGTMLQARPNAIHRAIGAYAKGRTNVNIITTNYDACIDQAFDELEVGYNYVFNMLNGIDSLSLVKMHGSINWFYCDTCQSVFLPPIETVESSIKSKIPYPVTGMCPNCNAPVKQFIIPPVAHKYLTHPPIVQVWDCGRKILEQANIVVIIGYSFIDADDYIAKMLVKAIGENPDKKVVIIDIDEKAIDRCRVFIKSHVQAFDEKKSFFPLCGDGLAFVPRVIESLSRQIEIVDSEEVKKPLPNGAKPD